MAGQPSRYQHDEMLRVPALCKDGRKIAVEFSLQIIPGEDGAPEACVAIMRDVSVMTGTIRKLRKQIAELEGVLQGSAPPRRED